MTVAFSFKVMSLAFAVGITRDMQNAKLLYYIQKRLKNL